MNKRLIICAERAFSISTRVNLINMALKAGYSVDIYARGETPEVFLNNNKVKFNKVKSWRSPKTLLFLKKEFNLGCPPKILVFNTLPLLIVALVLFTFKSRGAAIGVFTGLGRMSDLEGKLSLLVRVLLKIIQKLQKVNFPKCNRSKNH